MNRNRSCRGGNAVIEAALVLPILLGLAFGAIEFGYFLYVKHAIQGAATEAARAAITEGAADTDVAAAAQRVLASAGLQNSGYDVTTSPSSITGVGAGTAVSVTVQCSWGTVGYRPLGLISPSKKVSATMVMRHE